MSIAPALPNKTLFEPNRDIALWLLGYYWEVDPDRFPFDHLPIRSRIRQQDREQATLLYQDFHGLTTDAWWGPETAAMYDRRFCACPDYGPMLEIGEGLPRWSILNPTVSTSTTNQQYLDQFMRAVENWRNLPSKFSPEWLGGGQNSRANVWSTFRNIDGSSNVLAWSMLPSDRGSGESSSGRLEQRYDSSESWKSNLWDFLGKVIEHELGHAFGHPHYNDRSDRMFPSWSPNQPELIDAPVTVPETQKRYGVEDPQPPSPPQPPPGPDPQPPAPGDRVIDLRITGTIRTE